jgi:hypothetical protein
MNRLMIVAALVLSLIALVVALTSGPDELDSMAFAEDPDPYADMRQSPDVAELEARLSYLDRTVSNLVRRIDALERAPARAQQAAPAGIEAQLSALRSDVDALLTGEALGTDSGRQHLKDVVRTIQDEVYAERAQQQQAARLQAREQRLQRFAQEARLSPTQEQDVRRLLQDEERMRETLFERMRADGTGQGRRQVAQELRALRQRTDEEAQRILGADQQQAYQQLRREDRGFRGMVNRRVRGERANQ